MAQGDDELNWKQPLGKPDGYLFGLPVYFSDSLQLNAASVGFAPQPPLMQIRTVDKRTPLHIIVATGLQALAEENRRRDNRDTINVVSHTKKSWDAHLQYFSDRVGTEGHIGRIVATSHQQPTSGKYAMVVGGVAVEIQLSQTEVGAFFCALLTSAIDGRRCLQFFDDGSCQEIHYH